MKAPRSVAVTAGTLALAAMAAGCDVETGPGSETEAFDIPGDFPSFTIRADSGHVEVVGTGRQGIRVREVRQWSDSDNKPETSHIVRGAALTLKAKCASQSADDDECKASYRVEMPQDTVATLHTDSGTLRVSGLTGSSLRLTTGSGTISAKAVLAKTLSATSGSGAITVGGRADTVTLRTDGGVIAATGLLADRVAVHGNSRLVRLEMTSTPDTAEVTASRLVDLHVPDTPQGYAMKLTTELDAKLTIDVGLIRVRPPVTHEHRITEPHHGPHLLRTDPNRGHR